ncbi:MAG: presqualene diphosphate synthase HpnD [Acidobacteria bacterium]|nr:presqualene diphosphate synthase HpnD [Acidobacteriota bacterium]
MVNPDLVCEQITRASGTSFYYSFKVLPAEKRRAFHTVYAFCRHADDIVDDIVDGIGAQAASDRAAALDQWQREFDRCCDGRPEHPIMIALRDKMERFRIPREPFDRIIEGVRMDLVKNRYETFEELYQYCYRVAAGPGLACIHILGFRNPLTLSYAENLGVALQITNIIRDAGEDASTGRIYLPRDDMARFGCTEQDLGAGRYSAGFLELMRFECERARGFFRKSRECITPEDRRALLCPEIMAAIYSDTLAKIERLNFQVLRKKIRVSRARKLLLALTTCARIL